MPRQRPVRPALPLQEAVPAPTPPTDDPVYRTLLAAESTAYAAWLSYTPTKQSETKDADGRCAGARGSHRPGKGGANPYGTQTNPFRQLVSCGTEQLIQHIPGAQRRLEEDYS